MRISRKMTCKNTSSSALRWSACQSQYVCPGRLDWITSVKGEHSSVRFLSKFSEPHRTKLRTITEPHWTENFCSVSVFSLREKKTKMLRFPYPISQTPSFLTRSHGDEGILSDNGLHGGELCDDESRGFHGFWIWDKERKGREVLWFKELKRDDLSFSLTHVDWESSLSEIEREKWLRKRGVSRSLSVCGDMKEVEPTWAPLTCRKKEQRMHAICTKPFVCLIISVFRLVYWIDVLQNLK